MAYKVRKLFNLYNDWLFQHGFPEGRGLVESAYFIPFKEDDLSFFLSLSEAFIRSNLNKVVFVVIASNKLDFILLSWFKWFCPL